jgi:hypothetical protein
MRKRLSKQEFAERQQAIFRKLQFELLQTVLANGGDVSNERLGVAAYVAHGHLHIEFANGIVAKSNKSVAQILAEAKAVV